MNILLKDLVKRFGTLEAVSHISLEIKDGELFTLLGPSGCGKTTLLRLIGGFHKPDGGEIYFGDRPVAPIPPYERNIGTVFQNYALWPHLTIFDNIARQKRNLPPGSRFSCSARVLGDVLVTVPEESQAHKQVVLKAASGRIIDVDPIVRLYYLELEPSQTGDVADQSRALAELVRRFGLDVVAFDYPALPELSDALRQAGGAITLTVWNDLLVTRVQAGYHEQPLGLAVDIGSTTLAAYLCALRTGQLVATATAMNPQVTYGDDIMSRISSAG